MTTENRYQELNAYQLNQVHMIIRHNLQHYGVSIPQVDRLTAEGVVRHTEGLRIEVEDQRRKIEKLEKKVSALECKTTQKIEPDTKTKSKKYREKHPPDSELLDVLCLLNDFELNKQEFVAYEEQEEIKDRWKQISENIRKVRDNIRALRRRPPMTPVEFERLLQEALNAHTR